jgi:uncharacterized protein
MKLSNEFVVAAPIEQTWKTLLDVPRVARALPGATIEADPAGDVYRGTMKLKLGPVTTEYAGTARLEDVDEDDRVASFRVEAREARGQGTAAATITSRLAGSNGSTRVQVETQLQVTGRQAQLGRGMMEDVAGAILGQFSERLEREMLGKSDPDEPPAAALDVGGAVSGALRERALLVGIGVLIGLLVGLLIGGRR